MNKSILKQRLQAQNEIELAVLVGSRAEGRAGPDSDWDIAIQWQAKISPLGNLSKTEDLRHELATALNVSDEQIDLIDIPRAGLAMRALIAEEGIPLKGEDSLPWNHFLSRVWRELEDHEWEKSHAA